MNSKPADLQILRARTSIESASRLYSKFGERHCMTPPDWPAVREFLWSLKFDVGSRFPILRADSFQPYPLFWYWDERTKGAQRVGR